MRPFVNGAKRRGAPHDRQAEEEQDKAIHHRRRLRPASRW
jgi:hypothetical protein